jgi:hypothetical protein
MRPQLRFLLRQGDAGPSRTNPGEHRLHLVKKDNALGPLPSRQGNVPGLLELIGEPLRGVGSAEVAKHRLAMPVRLPSSSCTLPKS